MYVAIELIVGCVAFGICPAEKTTAGPFQNLIIGKVTNIDESQIMGRRDITLKTDMPTVLSTVLPEWRIAEFDFGGVAMPNPWFDQARITIEDTKILGFNPH